MAESVESVTCQLQIRSPAAMAVYCAFQGLHALDDVLKGTKTLHHVAKECKYTPPVKQQNVDADSVKFPHRVFLSRSMRSSSLSVRLAEVGVHDF